MAVCYDCHPRTNFDVVRVSQEFVEPCSMKMGENYTYSSDEGELPDLVEETNEKTVLMELVVKLVSSRLVGGCSCCDATAIEVVLTSLSRLSQVNLYNFEKLVLSIIENVRLNTRNICIKYIILSNFINHQLDVNWSSKLNMSPMVIDKLANTYEMIEFEHDKVMRFNGELLDLVKSHVQVIG